MCARFFRYLLRLLLTKDHNEREKNEKAEEIDDNPTHPSLDIALEEARRRFDLEEDRRSSIELKTNMLIGANTIIISFISIFQNFGFAQKLIIMTPALLSVFLGTRILELREYNRPNESIDEFWGYAKKDPQNAQDSFLLNYRKALIQNEEINKEKIALFRKCYRLTISSLMLIVLIPFIEYISEFLDIINILWSIVLLLLDFILQHLFL